MFVDYKEAKVECENWQAVIRISWTADDQEALLERIGDKVPSGRIKDSQALLLPFRRWLVDRLMVRIEPPEGDPIPWESNIVTKLTPEAFEQILNGIYSNIDFFPPKPLSTSTPTITSLVDPETSPVNG